MFSMTVWRAWAKNRKFKTGNLAFGDLKYKTVPVVLNAVPKEELSLRLCRFINEERRKDGTKYIYFILISKTRLESSCRPVCSSVRMFVCQMQVFPKSHLMNVKGELKELYM